MESKTNESDTDAFLSYFQTFLCNLQATNNELLRTILQKNRFCSFLSTLLDNFEIENPAIIEEFRTKVPLTTYEDYSDYINRTVNDGEKNLLSSERIIYFSTSSGTTGKMKLLPIVAETLKNIGEASKIGAAIILRSFPRLLTSTVGQRTFSLTSGKKAETFQRSNDGTPIGPLSQSFSALSPGPRNHSLLSSNNTLSLDLIEDIVDFETNVFVQLAFALATPNIYSYTASLPPIFIHTIKLIESYFEEICKCIEDADFSHSSLVQKHISQNDLLENLNQALVELTNKFGGETYRLERAKHIRTECLKENVAGILHRLWPTLKYCSTAMGSTFRMYKDEIRFHCGERLPHVNLTIYISSEGPLGCLASVHTDEYFLLPTCAFFEFIKEEDIQQTQPKTILLSEIEPGHRYELVCTTVTGLVRYRMGDVIECTRFLARTNDVVPLPTEPDEIPRIPLVSLAYRVGSLLNAFGEKTNEELIMNALQATARQWKERNIFVNICDFTSYLKLDAFPTMYVIFLELIENDEHKIDSEQRRYLRDTVSSMVEQQLCKASEIYADCRNNSKLDPVSCILVRSGTFLDFMRNILSLKQVSLTQVKPHRLLKLEQHIQFFYDHQIIV